MIKRLLFSVISMAMCLPAFCQLRGDLNTDGLVDVGDVSVLIDIVLGRDAFGTEENRHTFQVGDVSFTMVTVVGGWFVMGSRDGDQSAADDERPAHPVVVPTFAIGATEVTQQLWMAVMGSNPSSFTGNLQRPVDNVSWEDCQVFITRLNRLTGQTFRLPTEAEWEYAARGGNRSWSYTYAGSDQPTNVAWFSNNSGSTTAPVDTKAPNEIGLSDMSGNVAEWCSDWYGPYSDQEQTNPQGPQTGSYRVVRGGNWMLSADYCRTRHRDWRGPQARTTTIGFRLAM